jgi:hypothetical protein
LARSTSRWMAPAVPDAKDHDTIVLDAVADDVRMDDGGLAKIGARKRSAAIGKMGKTIGDGDQASGDPPGCVRIEGAM